MSFRKRMILTIITVPALSFAGFACGEATTDSHPHYIISASYPPCRTKRRILRKNRSDTKNDRSDSNHCFSGIGIRMNG